MMDKQQIDTSGTHMREKKLADMSACQPSDSLQPLSAYKDALCVRFGAHHPRYLHSLGVSDTAASLAHMYGVDEEKAAVAGLLHDWEKDKSTQEILKNPLVTTLGFENLQQVAPVVHGPLAALTLKERFPELTDDILHAIASHTTGDISMSDLDKIVYIADMIEPNRKPSKGVKVLRDLAGNIPLQELYKKAYASSLQFVLQKGSYLWPQAVTIYNAMLND